LILKALAGIVLLCAFVGIAPAQTPDLTGKWKIAWMSGGCPNTIQLTQNPDQVDGTYTTCGNEVCPVSGTSVSGAVSLIIKCQKWDIKLEGALAPDKQTIDGTYYAYGNSTGKFKMDRIVCMLPEGCNK
jgi:hypothetical protein